MDVHLIDGTYELFRYFYGAPSHVTESGEEVAAVRGVVGSMLTLVIEGATHVGVATDHVVRSFRNDLYAGYKTEEGMDPAILGQFGLLEEALAAAGFVVWPMVEHEADDALASAARLAAADQRVDRVWICTPDKDLGQCVGGKVVQYDRRKSLLVDAAAVEEKFGVPPAAIPDFLALVGDSADGFPGLPGFGAKTTAALLARYGSIVAIPADAADWDLPVRGAAKLAATLVERADDAALFRRIATVVSDLALFDDVATLRWTGPTEAFPAMAERLDAERLVAQAAKAQGVAAAASV
jgi:5'-3' exonuclease